ncbi:MAG: hypothetical protein ABIE36_03295 [Candidatus Diapherotrites archaeon]
MPKFVEVDEFQNDLKKIKFDIGEDLDRFKKALAVDPKNLNGAVKISNLGEGILPVYKARKFRCKFLQKGSRSGIRVIYTYNPKTEEIILIEIYYKGKKENHDLYRIRKYSIKI